MADIAAYQHYALYIVNVHGQHSGHYDCNTSFSAFIQNAGNRSFARWRVYEYQPDHGACHTTCRVLFVCGLHYFE